MADNDNPLEIAPVVHQTPREKVYKGAGNSHISYVEGEGFHETTTIPGLGQGVPISERTDLKDK